MGTPYYISPDAGEENAATPRSDISLWDLSTNESPAKCPFHRPNPFVIKLAAMIPDPPR